MWPGAAKGMLVAAVWLHCGNGLAQTPLITIILSIWIPACNYSRVVADFGQERHMSQRNWAWAT